MRTNKQKKKTLVLLLLVTIITGASAVAIGYKLQEQEDVVPDDASAWSADWGSAIYTEVECGKTMATSPYFGAECNTSVGRDPRVGYMWACLGYAAPFRCAEVKVSAVNNADDCFNAGTWSNPIWGGCGCDTGGCVNNCLNKYAGQYGGPWPYTDTCGRCKQEFTCSCSRTAPSNTPTPTSTPRPSNTPTSTPVPSNTPTNTPKPSSTPTSTPVITNTPTSTPVLTNTPTSTPVITNTPTSTPTNTPTPTVTPTGTILPTNTPTITPTIDPSVSVTPTDPPGTVTPLPPTALITDEVDRLIMGVVMIFVGWTIYWFGLHKNLSVLYSTKIGRKVMDVVKGESKVTYTEKMRKKLD